MSSAELGGVRTWFLDRPGPAPRVDHGTSVRVSSACRATRRWMPYEIPMINVGKVARAAKGHHVNSHHVKDNHLEERGSTPSRARASTRDRARRYFFRYPPRSMSGVNRTSSGSPEA